MGVGVLVPSFNLYITIVYVPSFMNDSTLFLFINHVAVFFPSYPLPVSPGTAWHHHPRHDR